MAKPDDATESSTQYKKLPEHVRLEEAVTSQPEAKTPEANQAWADGNRFLAYGGGPEGADGDGD